jgi:hypothetical protein
MTVMCRATWDAAVITGGTRGIGLAALRHMRLLE